MRSFTSIFMLSLIGIVLVGFFSVYFLFDALISNHIKLEAERELARGVMEIIELLDVQDITDIIPIIEVEDFDFYDAPLSIQGNSDSRPLGQRINANFIAINEHGDVLFPITNFLTHRQQSYLQSLVNFYTSNKTYFDDGIIVMYTDYSGIFYLQAVRSDMIGLNITYLLYTDVTTAMGFRDTVNQTLIKLLIGVAVFHIVFYFAMSSKFKITILKLCRYAETIGTGNFNETATKFKYSEFEQLSSSLAKMANMLQVYELNQKKFFQNVSHELKAPLMSIQGYAESILEGVFSSEKAAKIILAEGTKMTELVNGLLYISRLDSGLETSSTLLLTDIKNLIYDCRERLRIVAEKSNKQIVINHPVKDISFITDDKKLEVGIANILSNAIKYAETEVVISYGIDNDDLIIQIQDDGQGIDEQDLPFIFDRFYKGKYGNSGIGLAICKDVIEGLNGSVTVENLHQCNGAKFIITLRPI